MIFFTKDGIFEVDLNDIKEEDLKNTGMTREQLEAERKLSLEGRVKALENRLDAL